MGTPWRALTMRLAGDERSFQVLVQHGSLNSGVVSFLLICISKVKFNALKMEDQKITLRLSVEKVLKTLPPKDERSEKDTQQSCLEAVFS